LHGTHPAPQWTPIALFVAIWIVTLALSVYFKRKRTKDLTDVAARLGFTFQGEEWNRRPAPQLETPIFEKKYRRTRNIISGTREGMDANFFDLTIGQGRSSTVQTIAAFSRDIALPQFRLAPQDTLHKLSDAILHKQITFETQSDFAKRLRLTGHDEARIRQLFTPDLISFVLGLDPRPTWYFEGAGRTLVLYRPTKKVKADNFPQFVDETARLAGTFFTLCGVKSLQYRSSG
jgi:hypothetical protein